MKRRYLSSLLLSGALITPTAALAQDTGGTQPVTPPANAAVEEAAAQADPAAAAQPDVSVPGNEPDVSVPGGENIVVIGRRRSANVQRTSTQVVSVLSSEQIAKTGEGDIAGALQRVTGLSVQGGGFVYVRGLGDRYSLALLNGSPLPSPEPLKRVVPLDLFPTNVIASSLVQKSYSVNFPGEFGGGVINLTTKAIPTKPFLTIGASGGIDTETTGELGYTYYGSDTDWLGIRDSNLPPALGAYLEGNVPISSGEVDTALIAGQLVTGRNALLQRNRDIPANWGANVTGGTSFGLANGELGVIATVGYSNKWRTRDTIQQTAASADLANVDTDFRRVITDNRVIWNGLLGFGLQLGDQRVRWTNLLIRDVLKQGRLGQGERISQSAGATFMQQDTAWFQRELRNSQIVAELRPLQQMTLDLRAGYANSRRRAPSELSFEYYRSNQPGDPFGGLFINRLNNGQQGSAEIQFSYLDEDLYSGGVDLGFRFSPAIRTTIGYAYSDTQRETEVRQFLFLAPSDFPIGFSVLRPDVLLQPGLIDYADIDLIDINEVNPIFEAKLRNHGAYGQAELQLGEKVNLVGGVRYETAKQSVVPVQTFEGVGGSTAITNLDNDYWLPAATLTFKPSSQVQLRLSASRTIARPQFRELIFQPYTDPDTNRVYRGNPLLVDSRLTNAEARAEYYFSGEQRIAVAGFYKNIENPIEAYASFSDNAILASFVNAPKAVLYGAELEALKYFPNVFGARRLVVGANYTYSTSKLKVEAEDIAPVFGSPNSLATDYFEDGDPLTGQSDHIVNLELGFEHGGRLSQQTLLLNYSSDRVTNRGAANQPDIIEKPGIGLDFVAREGIRILGRSLEMKFEARNLLRRRYQELQELGGNKIFYNRYRVGRTFSLGASMAF